MPGESMHSTSKVVLPDFESPPVVETVLGFRFAAIPGWMVTHYGQLLQKFEKFYPKLQLKPPLGEARFEISSDADSFSYPVRVWFISSDDSHLVQVQDSCFIRNWRKVDPLTEYQHYDTVRPLFVRDWNLFCEFVVEQRLPPPQIWQAEVTYINHLLRGKEWSDFDDLSRLFPVWSGAAQDLGIGRVDMASFTVAYSWPGGIRLQFVGQPGVRKSDGAELFQLTVTASMRPESADDMKPMFSIDLCREAVVSGFTKFTTTEAHERWRRIK